MLTKKQTLGDFDTVEPSHTSTVVTLKDRKTAERLYASLNGKSLPEVEGELSCEYLPNLPGAASGGEEVSNGPESVAHYSSLSGSGEGDGGLEPGLDAGQDMMDTGPTGSSTSPRSGAVGRGPGGGAGEGMMGGGSMGQNNIVSDEDAGSEEGEVESTQRRAEDDDAY